MFPPAKPATLVHSALNPRRVTEESVWKTIVIELLLLCNVPGVLLPHFVAKIELSES